MTEENEDAKLNIKPENTETQIVDTLTDGTEILRDEVEEQEEEITDKSLRKLIEFATGNKNVTDEELEKLRKNDSELESLIRISSIKSSKLTYRPKKNFGVLYKKQRQRKNRATSNSRKNNR